MHIFLCSAEYTADDGFREKNKRYMLIIFAREQTHARAYQEVTYFLQDRGWKHIEVKKRKLYAGEELDTDDEIMRNAFNDAKEHGIGVVVYTDPIAT